MALYYVQSKIQNPALSTEALHSKYATYIFAVSFCDCHVQPLSFPQALLLTTLGREEHILASTQYSI